MAMCKIIKILVMLCNYDIRQAEVKYYDVLTFCFSHYGKPTRKVSIRVFGSSLRICEI